MRFVTRIKETGWFNNGNRRTSKMIKDIKLNPKIGFPGHLKNYIRVTSTHISQPNLTYVVGIGEI